MGFHLRKSINLGGIRLNLSNSGIGFSTGVKGLRVGVDGKGRAYIGGGKGILRYRKTIGNKIKNSYMPDVTSEQINIDKKNTIEMSNIPDELKGNGSLGCMMIICGIGIFLILICLFSSPSLNYFITNIIICAFLLLPFLGFNKNKRASYINRGVKYYNQGEYNKALQEFIKAEPMAIKLKWLSRSFISEQIYNCFINLEKYEAAIEFLKNNDDIFHKEDKLFNLYFQFKNWIEILQYFEEKKGIIIELINDNLLDDTVPLIIYESYFNLKKYNEALEFIKSIKKIQDKDIKVINCYKSLCKYEEVINYIQKEISDNIKDEKPIYYALLAEAFLKLEKKEIALETMLSGPTQKRTMDLEMCHFRYQLGLCYEANNDKENALKQFRKVYAYNLNFEDVAERISNLENKRL